MFAPRLNQNNILPKADGTNFPVVDVYMALVAIVRHALSTTGSYDDQEEIIRGRDANANLK